MLLLLLYNYCYLVHRIKIMAILYNYRSLKIYRAFIEELELEESSVSENIVREIEHYCRKWQNQILSPFVRF